MLVIRDYIDFASEQTEVLGDDLVFFVLQVAKSFFFARLSKGVGCELDSFYSWSLFFYFSNPVL